jgi:CheY-like chemotaxis protein
MYTIAINKLKILLVEDDAIAALVNQRLLVDLGYSADIAKDGKEALLMANKGYDLIFMDIGLPDGVDGFMVTEDIRKIEKQRGFKAAYIAALTAYNLEEIKAFDAGASMNAFLNKPVTTTQLQRIISCCLNQK